MNDEEALLYAQINLVIRTAIDAGLDLVVPWLRRMREREFAAVLHKAQP